MDASNLLKPLLAELEGRGYAVSAADLGSRIRGKLSRSGRKLANNEDAQASLLELFEEST